MNCVFEILYDLYGEPVWLNKPKDGQEPEKIIEQWIKELGDYSETQLKQACYNLFKYKKVATFPKLAHILAELSDQQKENAPKQPSEKRFSGISPFYLSRIIDALEDKSKSNSIISIVTSHSPNVVRRLNKVEQIRFLRQECCGNDRKTISCKILLPENKDEEDYKYLNQAVLVFA